MLAAMWLARCDPSEANAEVAQGLWEEAGCALPPTFVPALMDHLSSAHAGGLAGPRRASWAAC